MEVGFLFFLCLFVAELSNNILPLQARGNGELLVFNSTARRLFLKVTITNNPKQIWHMSIQLSFIQLRMEKESAKGSL